MSKKGMIQSAVDSLVKSIGEEEIKSAISDAVDSKVNTIVTSEINKVLETGIKRAIEKSLKAKLEPVLKAIESIDVSSVVEKVANITIGSDVDTLVEQLGDKLKNKIKVGIEEADGIKVDIKEYTGRLNVIIGEQLQELAEDDEDVESIVKAKLIDIVGNAFKL